MFKLYEKIKTAFITISLLLLIVLFIMPFLTTKHIEIGSSYTQKEDVALYIMTYHELPPNYITKYGLDYAIKNNIQVDDYIMGGDTHFNIAQLESFGVKISEKLKECDIASDSYYIKGARGEQRLVYTCNTEKVRVFYTYNHYETFEELTSFNLNLTRNVFWIIFGAYTISLITFYIVMESYRRKNGDNYNC